MGVGEKREVMCPFSVLPDPSEGGFKPHILALLSTMAGKPTEKGSHFYETVFVNVNGLPVWILEVSEEPDRLLAQCQANYF